MGKSERKLQPLPGDTAEFAVGQLLALARGANGSATLDFNGVVLEVGPEDDLESTVQLLVQELTRRNVPLIYVGEGKE